MASPKKNIPLLFIIRASMWFMVLMPVIIPFFQSKGLDIQQILMLTSIHSLVIALMEIPSGMLADRWGRRNVLLLGTSFFFLGYLGFCFSMSFWGFALAQLLLGIANSFISGTDSALLYDSLISINKPEKYTQYEGQSYSVGNIAESLAAIIGGLLAAISLDLPLYIQTAMALVGVPAAFLLFETQHHKESKEPLSRIETYKTTFKFTFDTSKPLFWIICISAAGGIATLSMAWLAQSYFESIDIPISWFGVLWAALNLSSAFFAFRSHKLFDKFEIKSLLILLLAILSLGLMAIGFVGGYIGLAIIFVHYMARGVATPVLRQMIQTESLSAYRATIMSIRSFVIRISYAIAAPIIGYGIKHLGLQQTFVYLGLVLFILLVVFIRKLFITRAIL
ncbi:MAG: putative MFS family arabinose efflux permease [Candidatus Azotimanducaceae bacterium]|jgi:predicted MFS family arabinose efflux permease